MLFRSFLGVVVIRQGGHDARGRGFAQQGDPIVGLLAGINGVVTPLPDRLHREIRILHLGFLQGQDLRLLGLQPVKDMGETYPQRIDIPGGDARHDYGVPAEAARLRRMAIRP